MRCAVVGLGKVGSVMAALYAASGHTVVGIDRDEAIVAKVNARQTPHPEPGLQELLVKAGSNLTATSTFGPGISECSLIVIIVPTPSTEDGSFGLGPVMDVLCAIAPYIAASDAAPTIVLASTVSPQSCHQVLIPHLESASSQKSGQGFHFVYSPKFIALGSVLSNLVNPDFVLVGESSPSGGDCLIEFEKSVVSSGTRFIRMSIASAELAKIAVNAFVTMKISFANTIGELCDVTPGSDAGDVLNAVGTDRRVGHRYLTAALGFGGPCFPRDNAALASYAQRVGIDVPLARATDVVNDRQPHRVIRSVIDLAEPPATVTVLGLSYKPDTPVVEASQSVDIANLLATMGFQVRAYDPSVQPGACPSLDQRVLHCSRIEEALLGSTTVVVATPWPDFAAHSMELKSRKLVDPWGLVN